MSSLLFRFRKSLINAPVAASFAILRHFMHGDDSEHESIWAANVNLRPKEVCGKLMAVTDYTRIWLRIH